MTHVAETKPIAFPVNPDIPLLIARIIVFDCVISANAKGCSDEGDMLSEKNSSQHDTVSFMW